MRARTIAIATGLLTAGLIVAPATPAAAAATTSVAGSVITVTLTGDTSIYFGCDGTSLTISGDVPSPTIACATVTQITINGDGGNQDVTAGALDDASFAANPKIVANFGAGNDVINGTERADSFTMGPGTDTVQIYRWSTAETLIDMGPDQDFIYAYGSEGIDEMTVAATGSSATLVIETPTDTGTYSVSNIEGFVLRAGDGADTIVSTGVAVASTTDGLTLEGENGDDTIVAGPAQAGLYGGPGTNTLTGGTGSQSFFSASDTDTINPGSGPDYIVDYLGLRAGGRTINGGTENSYQVFTGPGDGVVRVRPGSGADTNVVTASLARPGQQQLSDATSQISVLLAYSPGTDRGLADVLALTDGRSMSIVGDSLDDDLLDVTVPTGTWSVSGTPATSATITTTSPEYGDISLGDIGPLSVHGPWTNANRGFAHRVYRDLNFAFASESQLNTFQGQLDGGTTTRAQLISTLMNTDTYRGLDVDRVYVKYLRRNSDPGGRTSWINSLRNGKPLWRFRAQLFGSNEYFNKAGGTNAAYVARAYNDVLGRNPDPSGQAFWTGKLNSGSDRGQVALQFMNSPEARRRLVDDQFLRFLDRKPTPTEQTTWVAQIPSANGEQALIAFLAGSNTYYTRT